jgi:adenylate cyclase
LLELRIGIGINTGNCIVGNMGSEFRFDYSALGDSVNLAARLESETKGYDVSILLGEQTAELARAKFQVVELDRIRVKGKSLETRIFTIVPEAGTETLAMHAALLDDFYEQRLSPSDTRFAALAERLPTLAGYYGKLRKRTNG